MNYEELSALFEEEHFELREYMKLLGTDDFVGETASKLNQEANARFYTKANITPKEWDDIVRDRILEKVRGLDIVTGQKVPEYEKTN